MWNDQTTRTTLRKILSRRIAALPIAFVLVLAQTLLHGCVPAAVVGIAIGASVAHERRGATTVLDDQQIQLQAMADLSNDPDLKAHSRIGVTSYNYVVLLTGQTETAQLSQSAAEKISRIPKVRRVVNEIIIGPIASLTRESEDTWITSRVKFALTEINLPGFDPTRVKVVTETGVVYLMGLLSPEEADAAVEKARYIPGVEKVVKVFEYIKPTASPAAA